MENFRTAAAVCVLVLAALCGCSSEMVSTSKDGVVALADSSSIDAALTESDVGQVSIYDLNSGSDAPLLPGSFLSPCKSNSDCDSGLCTSDDIGKKFCTITCISTCPASFDCEPSLGGDTVYWCVPHCKVEKCNGKDDDCDGPIDEGLDGKTHMCEDGNLCTTESCNENGDCSHTPQTGASCLDGSVCTVNDVCVNATCTSGQFLKCNDNDPCTSDSCNPSAGCVYTSISAGPGSCQDGDVCTEKDFCDKGACIPGTPKSCEDKNDCTYDKCDNKYASSGGCLFQPVPNKQFGTCSQVGIPDGYVNWCIGGTCKQSPKP
jgi:hypothetical protein